VRGVRNSPGWIVVCHETGEACEETARYWLDQGGDRSLLGTLIVCAAVARVVTSHLDLGADLAVPVFDFLAEVCREAGEACEHHDDARLRECAERCFWCESCAREALAG
jgi:hypothetical protein